MVLAPQCRQRLLSALPLTGRTWNHSIELGLRSAISSPKPSPSAGITHPKLALLKLTHYAPPSPVDTRPRSA
jgi:hypothetical protein